MLTKEQIAEGLKDAEGLTQDPVGDYDITTSGRIIVRTQPALDALLSRFEEKNLKESEDAGIFERFNNEELYYPYYSSESPKSISIPGA